MTWNGKPYGQTGKGDKNRSDTLKVSENMKKIKENNLEWRSCGGCKHFKNGFDVIGNSLCKKEVKYNLNTAKEECKEWEWLNE